MSVPGGLYQGYWLKWIVFLYLCKLDKFLIFIHYFLKLAYCNFCLLRLCQCKKLFSVFTLFPGGGGRELFPSMGSFSSPLYTRIAKRLKMMTGIKPKWAVWRVRQILILSFTEAHPMEFWVLWPPICIIAKLTFYIYYFLVFRWCASEKGRKRFVVHPLIHLRGL